MTNSIRHMLHRDRIWSWVFLAIILTMILGLFAPAFSSYFFEDDWGVLFHAQTTRVEELLTLFHPKDPKYSIYFRPLGMEVPFWIIYSLFGINPLPFRFSVLVAHVSTCYVLYLLLKAMFREKWISFFGVLIYAGSISYFTPYYWASTMAFPWGTFYYLLCLYLFGTGKKLLTLLVFVIGLLTNELIVTLPFVLTLFIFLVSKEKKSMPIMDVFPFYGLSLSYVIFRFTLAPFMRHDGYSLVTSFDQVITNFIIYIQYMLNLGAYSWEAYVKGFHITILLKTVTAEQLAIGSLYEITVLVGVLTLYVFLHSKKKQFVFSSLLLFGVGFIICTLLPVMFWQRHSFAYYVEVPFVGVIIAFLCWIQMIGQSFQWNRRFLYGVLAFFSGMYYISSFITIRSIEKFHTNTIRASLSKKYVQIIRADYPILAGKTIITVPYTADLELALLYGTAFQAIYHNSEIETKFDPTFFDGQVAVDFP